MKLAFGRAAGKIAAPCRAKGVFDFRWQTVVGVMGEFAVSGEGGVVNACGANDSAADPAASGNEGVRDGGCGTVGRVDACGQLKGIALEATVFL